MNAPPSEVVHGLGQDAQQGRRSAADADGAGGVFQGAFPGRPVVSSAASRVAITVPVAVSVSVSVSVPIPVPVPVPVPVSISFSVPFGVFLQGAMVCISVAIAVSILVLVPVS